MRRLGLLIAVATTALTMLPEAASAQAAQRSAQSDCARELQRRGYTVISTRNFQQFRDGWQVDIGARDHRGNVTNGTCFVETRSGDVSLYGFGWGGSGTVDRFEFNCASKDDRYRECQLPVDGRARLVKRKSDAPCTQGRSWGQKGDRVWVDRGCRARFEVVRGGGGSGGSAAVAERACLGEAQRRGLRVVDWDKARPVQGGYSMQLRLRQGNQNVRAGQCTYRNSNGKVDLRY
jgi:hypothetical protein